MSNYRALAYHPTSGRLEVANEEYFGIQFADGTKAGHYEMPPGVDAYRQPDSVVMFEIAQEMAKALEADLAPPRSVQSQVMRDGIAALSRWREFTNAKETKDG